MGGLRLRVMCMAVPTSVWPREREPSRSTSQQVRAVIVHSDATAWLASLPEGCADLVYVDPPFNSGSTRTRCGFSYIDAWPVEAYAELIREVVSQCSRVLRPGGALWVHCDESSDWRIRSLLESVPTLTFHNSVVWNYYNKISNAARKFASAHDTLFLYSKNGAPLDFFAQEEARDAPVKFLKRKNVGGVLTNAKDASGKCEYVTRTTKGVNDVWRIPCLQPASREWVGYPTQKPLALLSRVIASTSKLGALVIDPMCGSGTTLLAARQAGRRFLGSDSSENAVAVAQARLDLSDADL